MISEWIVAWLSLLAGPTGPVPVLDFSQITDSQYIPLIGI